MSMSDSDTSLDGASAATGASSTYLLGYCHQCDRQVPLNPETFTCNVCSSGFVEILDETPIQAAPQRDQRSQSRGRTSHSGAQFLFNSNQGPTRVQFLNLPGEQFDLYGIMNSVLSDLMNPGRATTGATTNTGNTQFQQRVPLRLFQLHGNLGDYAFGNGGLDAIITQLLSQLENTGPPPASETQVQNLPVIIINEKQFEENVQCPICMEDFKLNEEAKKLPCNHFFHESCIAQWLKLHGTCPVCRLTLSGEDTSQREYIRPPTSAQNSQQTSNSNSAQTQSQREQQTTSRRPNSNTSQDDIVDTMDFD